MRDEAVMAARNNAEWCDAVCRAHGLPGRFRSALWIQPLPGPPYYPNAITLKRSDPAGQHSAIAELEATLPVAASVKDAFDWLDLTKTGFQPLFDAQWIRLDPSPVRSRAIASPSEWVKVETDAELARWESAWAAAGSPADSRVFLGSLLSDRRIAILGIEEGGNFIAGCIANRSADVVGLTNFFAPVSDRERYRSAAVAEIARLAPGCPIIGYDSGEELAAFQALGFRPTGGLRVWVRR